LNLGEFVYLLAAKEYLTKMRTFAGLLFSSCITVGLCFVPFLVEQQDFIKRKEKCGEVSKTKTINPL